MNHTFRPTPKPETQSQPWTLSQPAWVLAQPTVETLAANFAPISLAQMDAVALLNRVDTKFVLTTAQLLTALAQLQPHYWMLSIDGQRLNHYRTLYFDTLDFALYHAHVNERAERYKVRSREYVDSHLAFLEVKHKTRKDRTIKDRIPTTGQVVQMTPDLGIWLRQVSPLESNTLEPKLWNTFTRLTLVSKQYTERVTLDIDLTFYTADKAACLNGLAIAEVKMDTAHGDSPFLRQMSVKKIRRDGFSKYSIGVAMLYDQVKKNALKAKMLWLQKLMTTSQINFRPL
jgi:hypothetical protein